MPYREPAKMATITRSIQLDAHDLSVAISDWIRKYHPDQEFNPPTARIQETTQGRGKERVLSFTATWAVTKAVPATEEKP